MKKLSSLSLRCSGSSRLTLASSMSLLMAAMRASVQKETKRGRKQVSEVREHVCVRACERVKGLTERVIASLRTDVAHHDHTENLPIKVLFECVNHMSLLEPKETFTLIPTRRKQRSIFSASLQVFAPNTVFSTTCFSTLWVLI